MNLAPHEVTVRATASTHRQADDVICHDCFASFCSRIIWSLCNSEISIYAHTMPYTPFPTTKSLALASYSHRSQKRFKIWWLGQCISQCHFTVLGSIKHEDNLAARIRMMMLAPGMITHEIDEGDCGWWCLRTTTEIRKRHISGLARFPWSGWRLSHARTFYVHINNNC